MNVQDCIFCKIANGEIKTDFIVETDDYIAFKDIHPRAPIHVLLIPKKHFPTLRYMDDEQLLGKLFSGVNDVAKKLGISDFRTVINTGKQAGQEVFHMHIHILAGRPLQWPPG
jgi:histidine triad (HIT) family protein